jgi:hypothetical protein
MSRSYWVYVFILILFAGLIFMLGIHSFLAVTKPVSTNLLVVEGWLPDGDLDLAASEFNRGNYEKLIAIGGPAADDSLNNKNVAEQAVQKLISYGVAEKSIIAVSFFEKTGHKTFLSFIALQKWILHSEQPIKSCNIFTASVHARKSWTICQRVLNKNIKIGVIAAPPERYDARFWWLSKRGIRLVFKNTIGYFYALLFPWQRLADGNS